MDNKYPADSFTSQDAFTPEISENLSVTLDYIPDRGPLLWSRWILILLCLVQLASAFAVIGCHVVDFSEDTKLEVGISFGLLLFGNIFATGIVTLVLFYRRWRQAAATPRSKAAEENHEAWICTRAALSLVGMAPIARYVELFAIYRRLSTMESLYLKEPTPPSLGPTFQYRIPKQEMMSNASAFSMSSENRRSKWSNVGRVVAAVTALPQVAGASETSDLAKQLRKLRRLRRLFVQLDFDACVVALANASLGAGPFAIAQGVLYMRRLMLNRMMPLSTSGAILASYIFSFLWLASAACQFQPDAHYFSPTDLLRSGIREKHVSAGGRVLMFFARSFHIFMRLLALMLFVSLFGWLVAAVLGIHCAIYLVSLLVYRGSRGVLSTAYKANPQYRRPFEERLKSKGILKHLGGDLLYTYASIFDFFNGSAGKTRLRSMIYYTIFYLENSVMVGAWYAKFPFTASWYYLPALLVVVTVQWVGAIFLQLYFFYFSNSPRGTSLCGLCCPDELRGPVPLRYTPPSSNQAAPVQKAQPMPSPPVDYPVLVLGSGPNHTSLYSRRMSARQSLESPSPAPPSRTDSFTAVTSEAPRKPRSRFLYVRDPVEEEQNDNSSDGYVDKQDGEEEWRGWEEGELGGASKTAFM
ncbi:unnamed protein product [Mesocestoides corti]|uniref:XK-related protein n=1 Tax=Mesocestoides corti TaxID=53468 RepID=A0A0R3UES3_MESCO|nr:unnamed protein product [Mesocestoides corti]